MKKLALLLAWMAVVPCVTYAQDDDVYFIPSEDVTPVDDHASSYTPLTVDAADEVADHAGADYYSDSQIDAYNRRGNGTGTVQYGDYEADTSAQTEGSMTERLIRFHSPEINVYVSSPYYWDYYYDPVWWYSPGWAPCYSWSWGWAWAGPFWSWSWRWGWYDPFWGPTWGWGGWYDPFWRPPYWHHPLPPHHGGPGLRPYRGGRTIAGYTGRGGRNYGTFGSGSRGGSATYLRPSNRFGNNVQRPSQQGLNNRNNALRPSQQNNRRPTRTYNNSSTPTRPSGNRTFTPSRGSQFNRSQGTRSFGSPVISGGGRSYGGGGGMRGGGSRGGRR